jgi:hypothetical protein
MEQIRTKPATDKFRKGFDNIKWNSKKCKPKRVPLGEQGDSFQKVYVTNDPHFGG